MKAPRSAFGRLSRDWAGHDRRGRSSASLPLLIAFFLISGLRFVFDLPAALAANWIFRLAVGVPDPTPRAIARRFLLLAVLPWQIAFPLPWQAIALDMLFSAACDRTLAARIPQNRFYLQLQTGYQSNGYPYRRPDRQPFWC